MLAPDSANVLLVDPERQEMNQEAQELLDEVGANYRIVPGYDWRGIDPPWLFFSETGLTVYGIRGINDFVNLCWWHKVAAAFESTVGEERGMQWITKPNELLGGRTPLQAYREGDAKSVFGVCLAAMEGAMF